MEYIDFDKGIVQVKNIDGEDAAKLMTKFVNSFSIDEKGFVNGMANEKAASQQGFTKICWLWFVRLKDLYYGNWYDDRNKASAQFAQKVVDNFEDMAHFPILRPIEIENGTTEISSRDGQNVAQYMARFVNQSVEAEKDFIYFMGREHRTLQQSFTKVCWLWLKRLVEIGTSGLYDDENKSSVEFAQKVVTAYKDETCFPLI